jgi:hypothetical protein
MQGLYKNLPVRDAATLATPRFNDWNKIKLSQRLDKICRLFPKYHDNFGRMAAYKRKNRPK